MFRQETIQWNQTTKATNIAESSRLESTGSKLSIVVATDACLPQAAMAEAPLMARVLINYELPTKKVSFTHIFVHICSFYSICYTNHEPLYALLLYMYIFFCYAVSLALPVLLL